MDFFKSVFADDPDPPGTESESDSPKTREVRENPEQSNPNEEDEGGGWSFGGLMKTIATRSESVIETYRRDLEEFGTGLKKEIEVAQGSLGTMGNAIDELGNTVMKGTAEIIAQGKEAILAADNESDSSDNNSNKSFGRPDSFSSKPYSRFVAQVRVVQCDMNTYCEEPEDSDDYKKWEPEFSLVEKTVEMENMLEENGDMKGVYKKVVPNVVDHETFWFRYWYKVHKLKQAEDLRANLVKRAISLDDEEELSWDIDDEEETSERVTVSEATREVSRLKLEGNDDMGSGDTGETVKDEVKSADSVSEKSVKDEVKSVDSVTKVSNAGLKTDLDSEKEKKATGDEDVSESKPTVDSDASKQSEEELGWDEIEDMSSIDVKEASRAGGTPNKGELRKRLSAAEEDEDLSWDIEDEDEETPSSSSTKA
ncbi:unnamed protein product [Cochlearia groenlandica]